MRRADDWITANNELKGCERKWYGPGKTPNKSGEVEARTEHTEYRGALTGTQLMEPEGSLRCSHTYAASFYPKPAEPNAKLCITFTKYPY
jgi:hypothetical protein